VKKYSNPTEVDNPIEIRSFHHEDKEFMDFSVIFQSIDDLYPHEQIIDHELKHVLSSFKKEKILKSPILVSKEGVILDGHHRFAALKKLKIKEIPSIILDYYDNEMITVGTWYPIIDETFSDVKKIFEKNKLDVEISTKIPLSETMIEKREHNGYLSDIKDQAIINSNRDEIFQIISNNFLDNIRYADSPQLARKFCEKTYTTILSWSYTKKEIIKRALNYEVFLPKTTRHVLKYQFPDFNISIDELIKS
jgi:L-serine kinase (ADP)